MNTLEKKKPWTHPRHRIVTNIVKFLFAPYCRWRYGVTAVPFAAQGNRPYLILFNHQTPFDQFFVGMSFRGAVYYMATEDIFSLGMLSDALRWLVAPIPIRKQTTDVQAVMNCIRIGREGGSIALAPEGNRTYSGRTEYMNPAIAGLAQKLKLPIALYRIEGGYGIEPRWSSVTRRGRMKAYVSRVIEPEEAAAMTRDELYRQIREGLDVREDCLSGEFHHKKTAEYLERAIYVCPFCGLSEFHSEGDTITCKRCSRQIRYLPTKELKGVNFDFPFPFVNQWYQYQQDYVNSLDVTTMTDAPLFRDTAKLSQVLLFKKKLPLRDQAELRLYGDRITIDEGTDRQLILPFKELSSAVCLGRNKLNLYFGDMVYQVKGSKRFNALKYVNLHHRYMNISKGDPNGKFLGL